MNLNLIAHNRYLYYSELSHTLRKRIGKIFSTFTFNLLFEYLDLKYEIDNRQIV